MLDLGFGRCLWSWLLHLPEDDYAIREEDLPRILEEYDKLADAYLEYRKAGKGFNFFHFGLDLTQSPCVAKRLSGCGSGTEYLAVTPWGDFYPLPSVCCWTGRALLWEMFMMGIVKQIYVMNLNSECICKKSAWVRIASKYYCSGGCNANAYNFTGSITGSYDVGCKMQQKRIECAIMIKAALADMEEETGSSADVAGEISHVC